MRISDFRRNEQIIINLLEKDDTYRRLREISKIDITSISNAIMRLERRGLITREDKMRPTRINLNDKGNRIKAILFLLQEDRRD